VYKDSAVKRSAIKRRPLADSVLSALDLDAKDYRERDSAGLYFRVQKNGSKSWLLRYKRPCDTWAWKGLGGYPGVSGKLAREKARDLLNHSSGGKDLVHMSSCVQEKMTFKEAAEDWYDRKVKAGRVAGSLKQYGLYLNKDIYPAIGHKALDAVTRLDCAAIQSKMEARGAGAIAGKVRIWINQIFSLAMAQGHCTVNPASELRYLAQQGHQETPHPHLLEDELPAFLMALRKSTSKQITLIMTRLVLRTACRPGMALSVNGLIWIWITLYGRYPLQK
jgi:hypothetical protein